MRLAAERDILIVLCSQVFTLRATLRVAYFLNLKYRGFANLANAIAEGTFAAYQDVITAGCDDVKALNALLKPFQAADADITPLGDAIMGNRAELLEFVCVLAGVDAERDDAQSEGKPISFEEYHTRLYELGTGWLGWTPQDTWEAKPSEIISAYQGRQSMLKAIFGARDDDETLDMNDASDRAQLNALGDMNVTTIRKATR
jgi:hypothetical protein